MARVTEEQVKQVAGAEDEDADASQAIEVATLLTTEELSSAGLSEARLQQVELYLAAHFLTLTTREGPLASQTVDNSSERYHNIYTAGLRSSRFGQQAVLLDTSGVLARIAAKSENLDRLDAQFRVI